MVSRQPAELPPPPPVAKVDLYTHRFSAECMRAKALLDRKGAVYSEYIIDSDDESRQVMLARSGGQKSVPQIFINGRAIGGLEPLEALESSGQLDKLLAEMPRDFIAEETRAAQQGNGDGAPNTIRDLWARFVRR